MPDRRGMDSEVAATLERWARRKRCPGCAPGYGTGRECRHHQLVNNPDMRFAQRVGAQMRRLQRNAMRRLEVMLYA